METKEELNDVHCLEYILKDKSRIPELKEDLLDYHNKVLKKQYEVPEELQQYMENLGTKFETKFIYHNYAVLVKELCNSYRKVF